MSPLVRLPRKPEEMTAAEVWAAIEADPEIVAEIKAGQADIVAGYWYSFDTVTGKTTPNPDWPKAGPQPRNDVCAHTSIETFAATGLSVGDAQGLWACADCKLRFYPACRICVDVGHRSGHSADPSTADPTEPEVTENP